MTPSVTHARLQRNRAADLATNRPRWACHIRAAESTISRLLADLLQSLNLLPPRASPATAPARASCPGAASAAAASPAQRRVFRATSRLCRVCLPRLRASHAVRHPRTCPLAGLTPPSQKERTKSTSESVRVPALRQIRSTHPREPTHLRCTDKKQTCVPVAAQSCHLHRCTPENRSDDSLHKKSIRPPSASASLCLYHPHRDPLTRPSPDTSSCAPFSIVLCTRSWIPPSRRRAALHGTPRLPDLVCMFRRAFVNRDGDTHAKFQCDASEQCSMLNGQIMFNTVIRESRMATSTRNTAPRHADNALLRFRILQSGVPSLLITASHCHRPHDRRRARPPLARLPPPPRVCEDVKTAHMRC